MLDGNHLPEFVVVTGAAAGLGQELSRLLIENGSHVLGVDIHAQGDSGLLDSPLYSHVLGGVDDDAAWDVVRDRLEASEASTLGLAHCAAMLVQGRVEDLSRESWERMLAVNVIGTANAMRAVSSAMEVRGGGSIVLVGSVSGFLGEEAMLGYGASKGALLQMTRAAALDFGRRLIRVNAVSPGPMSTEMFLVHMRAAPDPQAFLKRREDRQPLGFVLEPRQVANAIAFFLSDAADGITGVNLPVDAGLTAGFEFRNLSMGARDSHYEGKERGR